MLRTLKRRARRAGNAALGHAAVFAIRAMRLFNSDRMADLAGALMRGVGPWLPEHRIGRDNLAAAFPEKSRAEIETILRGVWDNLGRLGAEFAHFDKLRDNFAERVEFSPRTSDLYGKIRDDGKPALLFAAHLANWEVPAISGPVYGLQSAVLYRAPNMRAVADFVRETRSSAMGTLVQTGLDAPVRLARALEAGMHVGMLVDQHFAKGVEVTFFGRRCFANPLLALLARQHECPIHGARVIRLPGHRFRAELTEEITPPRAADGRIDIQATMQAVTDVVEQWVREYPEQWLWLHRRWR